jgi:hypothetical protein
MTEADGAPSQGNNVALAAIAAIAGQSESSATEMFCTVRQSEVDENLASFEDIGLAIDRLCTRVGLAPALMQDERDNHIRALRELPSDRSAPDRTRAHRASPDRRR